MCGWTCVGRPNSNARRLSRDWIVHRKAAAVASREELPISSAVRRLHELAATGRPGSDRCARPGADRDDARPDALAEHADLAGRDVGARGNSHHAIEFRTDAREE